MHKPSGLGMLVGTIGFTVLLVSSIAYAQIEGALQYPPPSVGEDAQPPPPARMVPQQLRLASARAPASIRSPCSRRPRPTQHLYRRRAQMKLAAVLRVGSPALRSSRIPGPG